MTASDEVGKALERWVEGLPMEGEGGAGVLGDWIAVACMVDVTPSGQPVANYYLAMRDGSMLPHVAHGLLMRAQDELVERDAD